MRNMRKPYQERAVLKARQEAAVLELECKSDLWLFIAGALGIAGACILAALLLWQWLVQGESLDYYTLFILAAMPIAIPFYAVVFLSIFRAFREKTEVRDKARQRLAVLEGKAGNKNKLSNERGAQ